MGFVSVTFVPGEVVDLITEWLLSLGIDVFGSIGAMLPRFNDFDGVIVTWGTFLLPLVAGVGSTSIWIPWPLLASCLGIIGPLYAASFIFKLARQVWSYVPLFGGSG